MEHSGFEDEDEVLFMPPRSEMSFKPKKPDLNVVRRWLAENPDATNEDMKEARRRNSASWRNVRKMVEGEAREYERKRQLWIRANPKEHGKRNLMKQYRYLWQRDKVLTGDLKSLLLSMVSQNGRYVEIFPRVDQLKLMVLELYNLEQERIQLYPHLMDASGHISDEDMNVSDSEGAMEDSV